MWTGLGLHYVGGTVAVNFHLRYPELDPKQPPPSFPTELHL